MSDSTGWYARHVGGQPAARQQAPQAPAPAVHQPQQGYPPMQHGYPQNMPQQAPAAPQVESFSQALENSMAWQGEAAKTETNRCPSCGGGNFFSRSKESRITERGSAPPSPQCFDCGYNAVYHQEVMQNI